MSRSEYTPRPQSSFWRDGDCPSGVLAIFDNGGATADRYTVIYREICGCRKGRERSGYMMGRGMSENPFHPLGVGMSFELKPHEVVGLRARYAKQKAKWSSLPERVKQCVRQDLEQGL